MHRWALAEACECKLSVASVGRRGTRCCFSALLLLGGQAGGAVVLSTAAFTYVWTYAVVLVVEFFLILWRRASWGIELLARIIHAGLVNAANGRTGIVQSAMAARRSDRAMRSSSRTRPARKTRQALGVIVLLLVLGPGPLPDLAAGSARRVEATVSSRTGLQSWKRPTSSFESNWTDENK